MPLRTEYCSSYTCTLLRTIRLVDLLKSFHCWHYKYVIASHTLIPQQQYGISSIDSFLAAHCSDAVKLQQAAVAPAVVHTVEALIDDAVLRNGCCDVSEHVASALLRPDTALLIQHCAQSRKDVQLMAEVYVVSTGYLKLVFDKVRCTKYMYT